MSEDFPCYEEIEAQLWAVEYERDVYREALESIAWQNRETWSQQVATEALQRAGGEK